MKWFYYNDKRKRVGPFSDNELRQLAQTGVILPSTTVENESGRQALAERVAGLFTSPSPAASSEKRGTTDALRAFETRLEEWDAALSAIVKKIDALTECAAALERRLDEKPRSANRSVGVKSELTSSAASGDCRLSAGKHRVGTDIPPGRYRAEIRRGYASVTVEGRDDYQGYFLDTDVDADSYSPSCVVELRSGAKLTLDKPTDFVYLGALR